MTMEVGDFYYELPEELIAQRPAQRREDSRLMVVDRSKGSIEDDAFGSITARLLPGDVLVLNDTRVIPARLLGTRPTGGKAEVLLVRKTGRKGSSETWLCMLKPSKKLSPGSTVELDGATARVVGRDEDGFFEVEFTPEGRRSFEEVVEKAGRMPLPPYIKRDASGEDAERYQTVFAGEKGAVAAPTAGLHFTDELIEEIKARGVEVVFVTLHTGPGTFMPVRAERVEDHRMGAERYSITPGAFERVAAAKREGRRVVAVGTTSTRALEASVLEGGIDAPELEGDTRLFIYPGFEFKVVDALLTNFHLPGSTLIMLVSAFAGRELVLRAYREAVKKRYRFYSYGDAMLIV